MVDKDHHASNGGAEASLGAGVGPDGGAGAGDLSSGRRGGGLCLVASSQAAGGFAGPWSAVGQHGFAYHAIGDEAGVYQAGVAGAAEASRPQDGSSGGAAWSAGTCGSDAGASSGVLPAVPGGTAALPANPPALYRRYPRG